MTVRKMISAFQEETSSAHISLGFLLVDSRSVCVQTRPRLPFCSAVLLSLAFLLQRQFFLPAEHELSPPRGRLRRLGVQGQGRGLPGTSFLSRGFGSLALAAGPKSGQPETAALQSQGFRQTLGACVPRGPEPCHEGGEGEVRLCPGWG